MPTNKDKVTMDKKTYNELMNYLIKGKILQLTSNS